MVRTLSKNARASSPQDVPVWVAPTETTIWRPKKEMERPAKMDLKAVGLSDGEWYDEAQDRGRWRNAWSQGLSEH